MTLVEHLSSPAKLATAHELLAGFAENKLESDARMDALLRALNGPIKRSRTKRSDIWKTPHGKRAARIEARDGKTTFVFEEKVVPEFAQFVSAKLDDLFKEFQERNGEGEL